MIMVSVCLPSDALSQHLPSYLGFSYLGCGVSLHSCSSKAQLLLLTLDEGYLLTAAPPDLERGIAPLGPTAPAQPPLLGCGVAPPRHRPWPWMLPLLFTWGQTMVEVMNGVLPQKIPCIYCYNPCPHPCSRPPPSHAFTGDS